MSVPMPLEVGSDSIDDVKAAISEWEDRCAIDEGTFDYSYRVLLALEARLAELEDEAASDYPTGFSAMYFAIK